MSNPWCCYVRSFMHSSGFRCCVCSIKHCLCTLRVRASTLQQHAPCAKCCLPEAWVLVNDWHYVHSQDRSAFRAEQLRSLTAD